MTVPPIRHTLPHRQPDVDAASYHEMLRRIRSPEGAQINQCCMALNMEVGAKTCHWALA
jgi:hypothetical protein